MRSIVLFVAAAFCEIAGCFSFWACFRLDRPALWLVPGIGSLAAFAWLLSRVDAPFAGRAFAAYGGVYVLSSLIWLAAVERSAPDRWDVLGAAICLVGACIILWGPR